MEKKEKRFIFDADTHMSPYKNFAQSIDALTWGERMEAAGVDKALAWLLPQGVNDVTESNAYIYKASKQDGRILPFGWANVGEGLEKAVSDVKKCLTEYHFPGVKLNGAQNEYYIDGEEAMEVIRVIAELDGILAFHIGADFPDHTSPLRAERAAQAFPHMPVLMIHMGGAGNPDVSESVIETAKRNPNMYLVGSAISIEKVKRAIDVLGDERILFGSDTPFYSAEDRLAEYEAMLAGYGKSVGDNVLGLNAKKLFRL